MPDLRFSLLSMPWSRHPAGAGRVMPQVNADLHLVHTIAGSGALMLNGQMVTTTPQCVLAPPRGQMLRWQTLPRQPWEMINLHVQITLPDGSALQDRVQLPLEFQPAGLGAIHRQLRCWHRLWNSGEPLRQVEVAAAVQDLLRVYLRDHGRPASARPDEQMQRICRWIEQRVDEPFAAATLARVVGLSVSQMNRRFRAATGRSPQAYWQQQRAERCRVALAEHEGSLAELASRLGFSDVYYFCRWFKQQTGQTPGSFRRRVQGRVEI